jgi:hypothetical protein
MRYPSIDTIHRYLCPKEERKVAIQVRKVLDGRTPLDDEGTDFRGKKYERKLAIIDRLLDMHGVEYGEYECTRRANMYCQEPKHAGFEYLNSGDTYNATLLYDLDRGSWRVTTYGDMIEHHERHCSVCRKLLREES